MTSRFAQWTLDVRDSRKMAAFWSAALGYEIEHDGEGPHLWPPADAPRGSLTVWLQPTDVPKRDKNRNHPDLHVPDGGDVDAEVERLVGLGATRVDVGQRGDEGFVVLADPEGNEFCLLHRRHPQGA
ncbi:VOC family protein [Streptosporangium sp. NPDC023825]|uniref:VOC family protein n=1 Tax=Streptosporangium sp. NPDC023825 TaxID=3154909 RepID=UPI0034407DD1